MSQIVEANLRKARLSKQGVEMPPADAGGATFRLDKRAPSRSVCYLKVKCR